MNKDTGAVFEITQLFNTPYIAGLSGLLIVPTDNRKSCIQTSRRAFNDVIASHSEQSTRPNFVFFNWQINIILSILSCVCVWPQSGRHLTFG